MTFRRGPGNKRDKPAIEILDLEEQGPGYVPRDKNEVLARLLDAGKLVFGKIESIR